MTKKRIVVGVILLVLLIIALGIGSLYTIFYNSKNLSWISLVAAITFFIFVVFISELALFELLKIKQFGQNTFLVYILSFLALLYFLIAPFFPDFTFRFYVNRYNALILRPIDILVVIFLFLLVSLLNKEFTFSQIIFIIFSILFLGYFFRSIIFLTLSNDLGWSVLWYLFSITTSTDTMAYVFGRYFGKTKLAPNISPNKTVEGSVLGTLSSMVIGTFFACIIAYLINIHTLFFGVERYDASLRSNFFVFAAVFLGISFILSIFAQFGDLVFSKIKRDFKIKDFSNIFPGHGGLLDRIDSFIFVSGIYCIIYVIVQFST